MRDLRLLGETFALVVLTWLLLGWPVDRAIAQADGSVTWIPYARSALAAGPDWTEHLYRFGVLGGSAMHDAGGTPPLLQLCAWLGIGPTNTANLMSISLQVCFGFFGVLLIEGLATEWCGARRTLALPERMVAIWLTAFAPMLAWRLGHGHDNLLSGLLPFVTITALWPNARAGSVSLTALAFGAFAVVTGLSGLGPQTLVYSGVFGAPIALALVCSGHDSSEVRREHWFVLVAIAAALLLALPRFASMLHYQLGDDAGRGVGHSLVRSYGDSTFVDWLVSIPWTDRLTALWPGAIPAHETNYPLGPLVLLAALAWPARTRRLAIALAVSAVLAICFAVDVPVVTDALLAIPMLESFRVPARAILPMLVLLPPIALAALWSREAAPRPQVAWAAIVGGALCIVLARTLPAAAREPLAWIACGALGALARWRPGRQTVALTAVVAGLGVAAFAERIPWKVANDRIEDGPARLRDAVLAQAPEAASPLVRVQVIDPPAPFMMSTAFAAGLGSLDAAWFPPRRFLTLIGALSAREISPAAGVFSLTPNVGFPILQQLYNVRYLVSIQRGALEELPATPGAAWFPAQVHVIDDPGAMRAAIKRPSSVATDAWILRGDAAPPVRNDPACARARVNDVSTDALGQRATLAVTTPAGCVLIVSTNYVRSLHASIDGREVDVFPIDIALTGILVPAGEHRIVLGPVPYLPWWTRLAWLVGAAGLVGLAIVRGRTRWSRFRSK